MGDRVERGGIAVQLRLGYQRIDLGESAVLLGGENVRAPRERSPSTSPRMSEGDQTSIAMTGSSNTGRALGLTARKARIPAILNACSLESTS